MNGCEKEYFENVFQDSLQVFNPQIQRQAVLSSTVIKSAVIPNNDRDLLKIVLLKEKKNNTMSSSILRIYSDCIVREKKLTLQVSKMELFTENVVKDIIESGQFDSDWPNVGPPTQLSRIKSRLTELMSHLTSENEDFIEAVRHKVESMNETLRVIASIKKGGMAPKPRKIVCSTVELKRSSTAKVQSIVIKGGENRTSSISSVTRRLKTLVEQRANARNRLKRELTNKCVIKVHELVVNQNSSLYKGLLVLVD